MAGIGGGTGVGRAAEEGKWTLRGYDTFEGGDDAWYPLPGEFDTEAEVIEAAKQRLNDLEESQPSASSGGQDVDGIQDQVYIVAPDGKLRRFTG